jgi:predicted transcriptional regulator
MKTAVSIPDAIFERAEELARRLKKSRSELYREALAEYVARHEPSAAITEAMDRALDGLEDRESRFSREAARRVLEGSEG